MPEDGTGEKVITGYEDKTLIVKDILFFVSYYMKHGSAGHDNIQHVVMSHYEDDDILNAKRLLWQKVRTGVLSKFINRTNSIQRSSKDINCSDIIQAFTDIDKQGYNEITFVGADFSRIPKINPEELHNISVLKRLESLEKNFALIESGTSHNQIQITDILTSLTHTKNNVATHEKLIMDINENISKNREDEKMQPDKNKTPNVKAIVDLSRPRSHSDSLLYQQEEKSYHDRKRNSDELKGKEWNKSQHLRKEKPYKGITQEEKYERDTQGRKHRDNNQDSDHGDHSKGTRRGSFIEHKNDNVFGSSKSSNIYDRSRFEIRRKDSTGFMLPTDQWKKACREQRISNNNSMMLFVYNVPQ